MQKNTSKGEKQLNKEKATGPIYTFPPQKGYYRFLYPILSNPNSVITT